MAPAESSIITIDLNAPSQIVGWEIEKASQCIDLSRLDLSALPITNLSMTEKALIRA
jgi:hypothetical protein